MIDVENIVKRVVSEALTDFPDVKVYTTNIPVTETLPVVTVVESNNYVDMSMLDSSGTEHRSYVTYDVNVYTNVDNGKQLAKKLFTKIDTALSNINFVRTYKGETPNYDRSVFRLTGRYEAIVSEDMVRDGDTINIVYRR